MVLFIATPQHKKYNQSFISQTNPHFKMHTTLKLSFLFGTLFSFLALLSSCQNVDDVPKAWVKSQLRPVILKNTQLELMIPTHFYYDSSMTGAQRQQFINRDFLRNGKDNEMFRELVSSLLEDIDDNTDIVFDTVGRKTVMLIYERDYIAMHRAEAEAQTLEFEALAAEREGKGVPFKTLVSPSVVCKAKYFLGYIRGSMEIKISQKHRLYMRHYSLSDEINSYMVMVYTSDNILFDACVADSKLVSMKRK